MRVFPDLPGHLPTASGAGGNLSILPWKHDLPCVCKETKERDGREKITRTGLLRSLLLLSSHSLGTAAFPVAHAMPA